MAEASNQPISPEPFTFGTMNCYGRGDGYNKTDRVGPRKDLLLSVFDGIDALALQEVTTNKFNKKLLDKSKYYTFADVPEFQESGSRINVRNVLALKKDTFKKPKEFPKTDWNIKGPGGEILTGLKGRFSCLVASPETWNGKSILIVSYHGPYKTGGRYEDIVKYRNDCLRAMLQTVKKKLGEQKVDFVLIGGDFNYKQSDVDTFLRTDVALASYRLRTSSAGKPAKVNDLYFMHSKQLRVSNVMKKEFPSDVLSKHKLPTDCPELKTYLDHKLVYSTIAWSEDPTDEPNEESTDEPSEESTDEPSEESTGEPSEESTGEPNEESTDEPSEESTGEPSEESANKSGEASRKKSNEALPEKLSKMDLNKK